MEKNGRIRLHKDGKMNTKGLKRLLFMVIFAVSLVTSDMKILAAEQEPTADTTSEQPAEPLSDNQNEPRATGVDISVTTMMYAVKKVNVRKEPNTSAEILGELEAGTNIFAVELTDDGWYRVVYAGEPGYIRSDFLAVYSNMDMWVASEPEPVPIDEQAIIAANENADNQAAENAQESAADSENAAPEEEQGGKKNNTLAILIIILLVLIFTYAVIQIVRDNMKSDESAKDDSEDEPEDDFEIMDLDGK